MSNRVLDPVVCRAQISGKGIYTVSKCLSLELHFPEQHKRPLLLTWVLLRGPPRKAALWAASLRLTGNSTPADCEVKGEPHGQMARLLLSVPDFKEAPNI